MTRTRERTPSAASEVVGRQVEAARKGLRISQTELARKLKDLGVPMRQVTIARLESGDRRISVDEVFAIATALSVNPLFLLSGDYTNEDMPVTPDREVPPNVMRLWFGGSRALPGTDERTYRDFVPEEERFARLRRGVQHMQQSYLDYMEAAKKRDTGAMKDALRDPRHELERQQADLDREERLAAQNRTEEDDG
jgi:transcriptional regulator with XRE-family HTH domain